MLSSLGWFQKCPNPSALHLSLSFSILNFFFSASWPSIPLFLSFLLFCLSPTTIGGSCKYWAAALFPVKPSGDTRPCPLDGSGVCVCISVCTVWELIYARQDNGLNIQWCFLQKHRPGRGVHYINYFTFTTQRNSTAYSNGNSKHGIEPLNASALLSVYCASYSMAEPRWPWIGLREEVGWMEDHAVFLAQVATRNCINWVD